MLQQANQASQNVLQLLRGDEGPTNQSLDDGSNIQQRLSTGQKLSQGNDDPSGLNVRGSAKSEEQYKADQEQAAKSEEQYKADQEQAAKSEE